MRDILKVMRYAHLLKHLPRTGWNMEFPEGHKFKSRSIPNAETVGSHTYGVVLLSLLIEPPEGYDMATVLHMLMVHDLVEGLCGDFVVAAETDPDRLVEIKSAKEAAELEAIHKIAADSGSFGPQILQLWKEYEAAETDEAKYAKQLDKLEPCIQAYLYQSEGKQVFAQEFVDFARGFITEKSLLQILDKIEEDCKSLQQI